MQSKEYSKQSDIDIQDTPADYKTNTSETMDVDYAVLAKRIDSMLYAKKQKELQEEGTLDRATYNFKFTVDSCFEQVDQYINSDCVKCANIFIALLQIAENKARIRECQIRYQLPVSKQNSFFNYATNRIQMKKRTYNQSYPALKVYPNQNIKDEQTRRLWEESQKYSKEAHQLNKEWKMMMRKLQ